MINVKLNQSGFTLIEIILVVILLSIITALTVPNFVPTYNYLQVQKTTDEIADLMRYAQSRSIIKNDQVRLEFDSLFSKYWLTQDESGEYHDDIKEFVRFSGRLGRTFDVPSEITIEMDGQYVYFYPDGRSEKKRIYVCFKERCYTISTQEQRGYVRVFDSKIE